MAQWAFGINSGVNGHQRGNTSLMRQIRQARASAGFTIVELLIVIVVIAILAAITLVGYTGITNRANAVSAQAAAQQAYEAVSAYIINNSSQVPTTLAAASINNSNNTTYQYSYDGTANTFCLTATTSNVSYFVNNTSQSVPAAGACPGQGVNGVPPITNLVQNASGVQYLSGGAAANVLNDRYSVYVTYSANNTSAGLPAGVSKYFHSAVNTAFSGVHGYDLGVNPDGTTATTGVPVTAGTSYMISGYVRWSGTTVPSAYVVYAWYDSSNNRIGSNTAGTTFTTSSANTWYRVSQAVTAPSGAVRMGVTFRRNVGTNAIGDTFDLAAPMVTTGSTLYTYADGNSTNWIWNGTADGSTSTGPPS
ncbi:MAG TPA: type II secretion system protein [Dongiaceae bacterium]|nr:type II secretion system protein [Dongiaceae bacterium]